MYNGGGGGVGISNDPMDRSGGSGGGSGSGGEHDAGHDASHDSGGSGGGVMARARQFNRLAEENRAAASARSRSPPGARGRSRSTGRAGAGYGDGGPDGNGNGNGDGSGNGDGLRGRAMASVRNEYEARVEGRDAPSPPSQQEQQRQHQQYQREQQREQQRQRLNQQRTSMGAGVMPSNGSSQNNNRAGGGGGDGQQQHEQQQQQQQQQQQHAIVTPELLVDALSGHEDGLLAIAERLMEHYDAGYDAMGEAIIDAFADVQKLFQHVVEAAHMEGAAFEASRREEEVDRLREAAGEAGGDMGGAGGAGGAADINMSADSNDYGPKKRSPDKQGANAGGGAGGPSRHDEFIDQDVRDVLNDAIRRSRPLRDAGNHPECYSLYERACNSASALLPVDSDHRGRLQLSIARAESMSADRACAILKYAMDDVLRSGLAVGVGGDAYGGIDPSQRGDCVLAGPSANGDPAVAQSADEALASLVEEMKDVLSAPVYDNSPLRAVAERFWEALGEAQRSNVKTEERLEQKLASLKAEYLLAREEWEEKLSSARRENDALRLKYNRLLQDSDESSQYMEEARRLANGDAYDSSRGGGSGSRRGFVTQDPSFVGDASTTSARGLRPSTASVASFSSGLAQHARSIVGTLSCVGPGGERYGPAMNGGVGGGSSYNRSSSGSRGRSGRSDLGREDEVRGSRSRSSRSGR